MTTENAPPTSDEEIVRQAKELMTGEAGDVMRARQLLEGALREHPENAELLDLEVEILVRQQEGHVARQLLEEYLRYFPDSDLAASRFAWLLWELGEREEAIAEAKATLARNPANRRALDWLLEWTLELKQYELVSKHAGEGLEIWPDDPTLLLARGRAFTKLGNGPEATKCLDALLASQPDNEDATRLLAEVLLDDNLVQKAIDVMEPFIGNPDCGEEMLLRCAEASFRANLPGKAMECMERLVTNDEITSEVFLAEVHECLVRNMGTSGSDKFCFEKLEDLKLSDAYTVTLLEAVGARDNRAKINDVFQIIKNHPRRFPRAMARFLSTYHGAPSMPGTIDRWVKSHEREIEENVILWGGVGAWLVAKSNWRRAIHHLSNWDHRRGVKPWMLHLLGRAHEALGEPVGAMNAYRAALSLPPDHTEAAIRSKLAFQMALEGMAGAGRLILLDLSEESKKLGTVEDLMRTFAVQAFADVEPITSPHERAQLLQESFQQLRQLARQDPYCNPRPILRAFRERSDQLIQLARLRESPPEPTEL